MSLDISNLFSVESKVAVVTGGSRGIGEMLASGFLANGAKVYITARKEDALNLKAKELAEKFGGECIPFCVDLSNIEGVNEFVEFISDCEPEGVDFLINNAGAAWGHPFESFPESGWDKVMDLNVKSPFFLTQKFKPLLAKKGNSEDPSRVLILRLLMGSDCH